MLSLNEIQKHLTAIVFNDEATISGLLHVVIAFAVLWFIVFAIVKAVIRKLIGPNPKWLIHAIDKDYERGGKKTLKDLQINMTKSEYITFALRDWPRLQSIYLQHFIGSLFCIPSLLRIGDLHVGSSLAICGLLSEMGWELQDMIEILTVRAFYKDGKKTFPDAIVVILLIHHSLASGLGIPMILYYRNNRNLHWLCFDLQFAAGLALAIGEITKLLDISKPKQLYAFKALNFIALITMGWTRVIHWTYNTTALFITFYNDRAWAFLFFGIMISIGFTAFSYLCCVKPFYKKFIKFLNVSAEYEALPADASPDKRRSSVIQLNLAVAELLDAEVQPVELLFQRREVSRRQSVPVLRGGGRRGSLSRALMHSKSFAHGVTKSKDI